MVARKAIPLRSLLTRFGVRVQAPQLRRKGYVYATWINDSEEEHDYLAPWGGEGRQLRIDDIGPDAGMTFTPNTEHSTFKHGFRKFVFRSNNPTSVDQRATNGHGAQESLIDASYILELANQFYAIYEATGDKSCLAKSEELILLGNRMAGEKRLLTADVIDNAMVVAHSALLKRNAAANWLGDRAKAMVIGASAIIAIAVAFAIIFPILQNASAGGV